MKNKSLTRREMLAGTVGAAAIALSATDSPAQNAPGTETVHKWGRLPDALGERSPAEQPKRLPSPTSSRTPLQDLDGTITPSDLHYERHHGGVAVVDPRTYQLMVHGMVDRPLTFTLDDLRRFPQVSRICFLECSGNLTLNGGEQTTAGGLCGLTSQSEWTGVMLSTIFKEVGAHPQATWFLAEGQDAAVMTRSIPLKAAIGEAMLAYVQNGEPLRPEQGYPVRLLLPGWEGNANVKWLRRLELADQPFMTREETSKYTDPLADGTARQFSLTIDARSIITTPSYPHRIVQGWNEIRGIAWSGRGVIRRVDISTDKGQTWKAATLQQPVLPKAHTRFRYLWQWDGKPTEILSRAVDETGYVQPEWAALEAVRGRRTRYHENPITGWTIASDGNVRFAIERVRA